MLSDVDIRNELGKGIIIEPFAENCLTPVGYDLRVGRWGVSLKNKRETQIDKEGRISIGPNDTVVIETYESIKLSKDFSGTIHSMVTLLSAFGITHISTTIDPRSEGPLLIQFHNPRPVAMELAFQQPFCTVCFHRMESPAAKGFNKPVGRTDIKTWLKREVGKERGKVYRTRRFWFGMAAFLILLASLAAYFYNPDLVIPIATVFGVVSLFVIEFLRSP